MKIMYGNKSNVCKETIPNLLVRIDQKEASVVSQINKLYFNGYSA